MEVNGQLHVPAALTSSKEAGFQLFLGMCLNHKPHPNFVAYDDDDDDDGVENFVYRCSSLVMRIPFLDDDSV
jgi:hypothetical protein